MLNLKVRDRFFWANYFENQTKIGKHSNAKKGGLKVRVAIFPINVKNILKKLLRPKLCCLWSKNKLGIRKYSLLANFECCIIMSTVSEKISVEIRN